MPKSITLDRSREVKDPIDIIVQCRAWVRYVDREWAIVVLALKGLCKNSSVGVRD